MTDISVTSQGHLLWLTLRGDRHVNGSKILTLTEETRPHIVEALKPWTANDEASLASLLAPPDAP